MGLGGAAATGFGGGAATGFGAGAIGGGADVALLTIGRAAMPPPSSSDSESLSLRRFLKMSDFSPPVNIAAAHQVVGFECAGSELQKLKGPFHGDDGKGLVPRRLVPRRLEQIAHSFAESSSSRAHHILPLSFRAPHSPCLYQPICGHAPIAISSRDRTCLARAQSPPLHAPRHTSQGGPAAPSPCRSCGSSRCPARPQTPHQSPH